MADMAAIMGLASSLKTAGEITKALIGIRDGAMIQSKVIELNGIILAAQSGAFAAQSAQFSLLERVRELEARVAQMEAWDAEKQRYALTDYGGGTFAYTLKPEESGGEPPHRICPACYEKGHKSVLQNVGAIQYGRERYRCPSCKTVFHLGAFVEPKWPERTVRRSSWMRP